MNRFLISVLSIAVLAACQGSGPDAGSDIASTDSAATLFYNGTILTMDAAQTEAGAMVISGDTVAAIGGAEALRKKFPNAVQTDLEGRTVLPGIIDSHVHVRELGMDRIKANLVGVKTTADITARLQAHFPNPEPGGWLIGQGWDEGYFASIGYPDRAGLDAAFPNNPVALESLHGFGGFYNGAALAIAGISADTPDPEVGDILRRADGSPTGTMLTLAQGLVNQHIPEADQAQIEAAMQAGMMQMAEAGVTSIHEAGMRPQDVAAFQALAARGDLPIRAYGLLDGNDKALMQDWFAQGPMDDPKDWLDIRGIKVFYDGSLGSRTALMKEPYSDEPDAARPTERITPEDVKALADAAAAKGFQMAVHAIGDEGNNRTLGIYEAAQKPYPGQDHRWRVEHAQVVLPDYYDRAADLGVLSSVQSSHAVGDSAWAEDRVGPARIQHAYAWQKILGAGGKLMLNSDLPGEPWTPMETLYFAVTRQRLDGTPAGGWYADEALSVDEALYAMTVENAFGAFQEDKLGQLAPGYWADFIVLDKNPKAVAPADIPGIAVTETWVAGRRVH